VTTDVVSTNRTIDAIPCPGRPWWFSVVRRGATVRPAVGGAVEPDRAGHVRGDDEIDNHRRMEELCWP
jgi:hypothetical protein